MKRFITKMLKGFGEEWRENPMRTAISVAILVLTVILAVSFFTGGGINLEAKHGDTEFKVQTKGG